MEEGQPLTIYECRSYSSGHEEQAESKSTTGRALKVAEIRVIDSDSASGWRHGAEVGVSVTGN